MIRGLIHRFGGRFALMLGGEAVQSAFHFGVNVVLLHVLTPRSYGIFAIVMLTGGIALTYVRALCGVPASLFIPPRHGTRAARAYAVSFGSGAVALSILIGIAVAATMSLMLGEDGLAPGLFVGLWSLRSYVRIALFAERQQVIAGVSDCVFTLTGLGTGGALLYAGASDPFQGAFLVLALANAAGIVAAFALHRRRVRVSFGSAMRRRYHRLAGQLAWSCTGVTTANFQAQGQVFLVALIAGPAAYAPIAAMLVFFAPLRLIASALANMVQPEMAAHVARGEMKHVVSLLLVWTAVMGAIGLLCGLALMLALPRISAAVLIGQPKALIGFFVWTISSAPLLYVMPRVFLEVIRSFRIVAVMTAISACVGVALGMSVLAVLSPAWSLIGSFTSEAMVLVWSWVAVLAALRSGEQAHTRRQPASLHAPPTLPPWTAPHGGVGITPS